MPLKKIGRVTSASVEKGTGKDWDEWLKILNKSGAKAWTHQEIVAFLKKKYKLTSWWQQGVTHGFEVATGRRIDGQSLKGEYGTVATRTVPVGARETWDFLWTEEGLTLWLTPMSGFAPEKGVHYEIEGGVFGEVRTVKPNTHVRMSWQEAEWPKPSIVQMHVLARGKSKSIVIVTHESLKTAALREQMREFWKQKLDQVQKQLRARALANGAFPEAQVKKRRALKA